MLAARIMERQLNKAREEAGRKSLEQHRKRNHFDSTECTCTSTTTHLFYQLKATILSTFDTDKLTQALRNGPDPEEKIRIWNEIKLLCFCKSAAFIICQAFLGILLRVQLNVLAGYLYTERVSITSLLNNNRDSTSASRFPMKVQEHYLSISDHFIKEGFTDFCEILLVNVKKTVDQTQLQDQLNLGDIERIFHNIFEDLYAEFPERNLFINPGKFVLSSKEASAENIRDLSAEDVRMFTNILSETLEILESQEILGLMRRLCRQGFSHLTDQLTDNFVNFSPKSSNPPEDQSGNSGTMTNEEEEFESPCRVRIPLARLLPAITGLVQDEEVEDGDEWLTHILEDSDLKLLSANIYETFCVRSDEMTVQQSWMQYLHSSISSYF